MHARFVAVAHDVSGSSARCRHQLAMHYEKAMVISLEESLHDHRARMLPRCEKTLSDLLVRCQPD